MFSLAELISITIVFGATYFLFAAMGVRRDSLFYTKKEKLDFDQVIAGKLGKFATITNIFGTLTSLATVYIFFIGTSKIFGAVIFATLISLITGALVTNYFTAKIMQQPYPRSLYENAEQISAVFASLFWRPTSAAQFHSAIIKYINIFNIAAVLWLEFAVFADLTGLLGFTDNIAIRSVAYFFIALAICIFILQFGLRGFAFADLLQSPLIAIGSVLVLGGICYAVVTANKVDWLLILKPVVPTTVIVIFILHVFVANSFFVLVTEGHWMRIWLYGKREMSLQVPAISYTALGWFVIIIVGLVGGTVSTTVGDRAVAEILRYAGDVAPVVVVAFWIAAISALFSTVDANIYGGLLVYSFNSRTGKLRHDIQRPTRILVLSLSVSAVGAVLYYLVRLAGIPIEKLVFVLIPICLNNLPALASLAFGREPKSVFTIISLLGYATLSIVGLLQPERELLMTLSAALVPLIVSIIAVVSSKRLS